MEIGALDPFYKFSNEPRKSCNQSISWIKLQNYEYNFETKLDNSSSDVDDASWQAPTARLGIATAPIDIRMHSWGATAASGSEVGMSEMLQAARVLGVTALRMIQDKSILEKARAEHIEDTKDFQYSPVLEKNAIPPKSLD